MYRRLGTSTARWNDLYVSNINAPLSADATSTTAVVRDASNNLRTRTLNAVAFNGESDPKVGTTTVNIIPKWNGSSLINSQISDNGTNVGIGTAPSYKLHVNGSVGATAFFYASDIGLKKDLVKITNPLEKIAAINGYYFTWKSDNTKDLGVVAQEIEEVFPAAVNTAQD
jgi:hypothetical protein